MSYVSNIILKTSIDELAAADFLRWVDELSGNSGQMKKIDEQAGGCMAMELDMYIGAYTGLIVDRIVQVFEDTEWQFPEEAQLLIQDQDDDIFTSYTP